MSDGEINGNYVLAQQRTSAFLKYSTESIKHNNDLEKALGQTEDDFKNEVLKELERACNSDLSYLDCFELLEIASRKFFFTRFINIWLDVINLKNLFFSRRCKISRL